MERVLEVLEVIVKVVIVVAVLWFVASYIDVVTHNVNLDGGTVLKNWNFFKIVMEMRG